MCPSFSPLYQENNLQSPVTIINNLSLKEKKNMNSVLLSNPKVRDFSTGGPSQKAEIQITKQS